jgi:hypothetical protein
LSKGADDAALAVWFDEYMNTNAPPTARQVYAIARALCEKCNEEFPADRGTASELIERLRRELGHPSPRLEDAPRRSSRGRSSEKFAAAAPT